MKKYYGFFLLCICILGLSRQVLAYDMNTTHPELTRLIVDKYNQGSSNKIDEGFKEWLVKGSTDEDQGLRAANHFFDPIYNRT
jgi:5'(3')-deoxyribonucleotidase